MNGKKVAVIGAGKMGTALAIALNNKGFKVTATRRTVKKLEDLRKDGIETTSDNRKAIRDSQAVVFSLKPWDTVQQMQELSEELEGKTVISVCSSLPIEKMESILPGSTVIRAMTNIAARSGAGYTIYSVSDMVTRDQEEEAAEFLRCFGDIEKIEERYMDALTPISGSGPAYIFSVIEAMVYAGLKVGIPRDLALRASHRAVMASAKLMEDEDTPISELKETFITPGGVTIEALYELENSGITAAFMKAIEAAAEKAKRSSTEFQDRMNSEIEEENIN